MEALCISVQSGEIEWFGKKELQHIKKTVLRVHDAASSKSIHLHQLKQAVVSLLEETGTIIARGEGEIGFIGYCATVDNLKLTACSGKHGRQEGWACRGC